MKKKGKAGICGLFVLIVLPCLFTGFICGKEACPVVKKSSMEDYVAAVTATQISWSAPKEAIKAQTVIARGNLYVKWRAGKGGREVKNASIYLKKRKMDDLFLAKFQIFQEAAKETENQVLVYENEVKEIPYHELGTEKTRDGKELLGEAFSYLPSVETFNDKNSPLYVRGCYFNTEELRKRLKRKFPGFEIESAEQIEIKATDSVGYVMIIQIGNQEFQGESIKEFLELPSSCFMVQSDGEEIRFLCRGSGHGLGMSQYTASVMAQEKKDYKKILNYFFPVLEIENLSDVT